MKQPLATDIFISRAGADKDLAVAIAKIVRDAGCNTYLQDQDFGHARFMVRMAQGFANGARMIALLSRAYQQTEYCKNTNNWLFRRDAPILEMRHSTQQSRTD